MVKTYVLFTALALLPPAVVLPWTAVAQSLRLEDPIRQQERWQRDFERAQDHQARDARDQALDREIIRNQEDILREMRNQEIERDWRERERKEERQKEREQDRHEREQERRDERAGCAPGYHDYGYGQGCSR
jgi:hypothetical protein